MSLSMQAVLFDLDGTLIDSIGLIIESYHHTLAQHGKPAHSDAEILAGVGTPLVQHLGEFADGPEELGAMVETYLAWNRSHHDERVCAYPGVEEGVSELADRGMRLAIVTSKKVEAAERGLAVAGLDHLPFEFLIGPEDTERGKPAPDPLLEGLRRLDLSPDQAAYVGDSPHDMAAAKAARMRGVAAIWGPFEREVLEPHAPAIWLHRPVDLAGLGR